MSTLELRHRIIEHLSSIEDVSFLNAIKIIIESKVSDNVYTLNDIEKKRIDRARQELKDRQTVPHEELQKEIDQWLNKK